MAREDVDYAHPELVSGGATTKHTHAGSGGLGYALNVMAANLATIADATTYYFGGQAGLAPQTTAVRAPVRIPKTGTVKAVGIIMRSGTVGTGESISVYFRWKNQTDTLISTLGSAVEIRDFRNYGLAIAVAQDDYFEIKVVCPTWATNPAQVTFGGWVYIE